MSKNGFMNTLDNGYLIPNKDLKIGLDEFYNCFLDLNGVDAKLADIVWFKNHFRWIIWKLISYDLNFNYQFTDSKYFLFKFIRLSCILFSFIYLIKNFKSNKCNSAA